MDQDTERAADSLEALYESGGLSEESKDALLAVRGVAPEIGGGLGDTSSARELLLASILVDDSTSIGSLVSDIHHGHGLMLEALRAERHSADVQVLTRALNRGVVSPYTDIARAMPLNAENFSTRDQASETPLYLQSLLTLGTVMAKAQEIEEHNGKVRTFTLIITDGGDNASGSTSAVQVRAIVKDMLEFHTNHIVAGMGIGGRADYFTQIFLGMGIPKGWIFAPRATVDQLQAVFRKIAKSLELAASSDAEFAQLAAGPPSSSS
jgi:hypothetical protein